MHRTKALFWILSYAFVLLTGSAAAQTTSVSTNSLEYFATLPDDTNKANALYRIGWDTAYYDLSLGLRYCKEALRVSKKIKYTKGILMSLNGIGATYNDMGDYSHALDAHLEALKVADSTGNRKRMGVTLMNLSLVYSSMKDTVKARECLMQSIDINREFGLLQGLTVGYINLGAMENMCNNTSASKLAYIESLRLSREVENPTWEAHSLSGIALCEAQTGNMSAADSLLELSFKIGDSVGDQYEIAKLHANAAEIRKTQNRLSDAETHYLISIQKFRAIGVLEEIVQLYKEMSELYEKLGKLPLAVSYWKEHMKLNDSLVNEDVLRHQRSLEALYESEKKQREIDLLTGRKELRKWFIAALSIAAIVLVFFIIMMYKRNQFRRETNKKLHAHNTEIESRTKEITDSIDYAGKIQEAVIPSVHQLQKEFSDAFVFSKPKDIVSGDFWWCTSRNGEFFLAGADCTGHGVPGGFMSIMGSVFLFEVITEKGIRNTDEILNELRARIIFSLKTSGQDQSVKDGMDMVMCRFSKDKNELEFSCAMNPMWVVRGKDVIEYKADKFPVGEHHGDLIPFSRQTHTCVPGDMIYIFSDGFADQFGGPDGKKFKYRPLRELLQRIADLPCKEQQDILEKKFVEWKGDLEQVDDVLIVGIRI